MKEKNDMSLETFAFWVETGFELFEGVMSRISTERQQAMTEMQTKLNDTSQKILSEQDLKISQVLDTQAEIAKETYKKLSLATTILEDAVKQSTNKIIEKLEADKQEQLLATIKAARFAMEVGQTGHITNLAPQLMVLIEYAKNRTQEGKFSWLGSWVVGQSVWLMMLEYGEPSIQLKAAIDKQYRDFRITLLDILGSQLIQSKSSSWVEIASFVNGNGTEIIPKLILTAKSAILEQESKEIQTTPNEVSKPVVVAPISQDVPVGRKQCKKCGNIEFAKYINCPRCYAGGMWWK